MAQDITPEFNAGLSDDEKNDLEDMIKLFAAESDSSVPMPSLEDVQKQISEINGRLAHLTEMFLKLDKRMQPLYETMRLSHKKSEIMNQRIDLIINSIKDF